MKHWKPFFAAALVRALRTVAQSAVGAIGAAAVLGQVDWRYVLGAAGLSGLMSMLTSIATGLPEVETPEEKK